MDPFDDLLHGVRGEGSVFGASVLSPPWALTFTGQASLTLCVPLRGEGWIIRDGDARRLREGEAAIVRGPEPFVFSDTEAPRRVTNAWHGDITDARHGGDVSDARHGGDITGDTVLLVGSYLVNGEVARRLVRILPSLIVLPEDADCAGMRAYLEAQLLACRPGRQIVLDRLLDWLLVCTLRDWFDRPEAEAPGWYAALGDDVVGPALRAIHDDPSRPWTIASLAAVANVSRTTLAGRFTKLVGEPPLTYLTGWRMALAADLLNEPGATVASVAHRVGYADAFSFSSAFKRIHGSSPNTYRQPGHEDREPLSGLSVK
ncbi:AraC family transcriptional regulator [Nonomuraea sp. NPDC050786]|uniref:AraC family transcriptional regulator n=1 Tax=Nonomuraea sp. NPDC050786 TaxID=3154840 RepID=UPI0033D0B06C